MNSEGERHEPDRDREESGTFGAQNHSAQHRNALRNQAIYRLGTQKDRVERVRRKFHQHVKHFASYPISRMRPSIFHFEECWLL